MKQAERNKIILTRLKKNYPEVKTELNFSNIFELLVATILSAQCTDQRVNIVTQELFKKFKSPADFVKVSNIELEKEIFSTGFYKAKANSIKSAAEYILKHHNGTVPKTMDELVKIPGVGRKTASVVLGNGYGIPAIPVDTHVKRLSNLFGMVKTDDPEKIEYALMEIFPKKEYTEFSHRFIQHGRAICNAKKPKCDICFLNDICPSAKL